MALSDHLVDEGRERSVELLRRASRPWGFAASAEFEHYDALWVRDAALAVLGATHSEDQNLIDAAVTTVQTICAVVPESGHVPAVMWDEASKWDWAEGGVVDANAWFVIAAAHVIRRTGDSGLASAWRPSVEAALHWLSCQDVTGTQLISAAPATDWMDSSLVRSGRTLHLNVLYVWAMRSAALLGREGAVDDATGLAGRVNTLFWPEQRVELAQLHPNGLMHQAIAQQHRALGARPRLHYVSHVVHAAFIDRCDVLANLLAVISGTAELERAESILDFMEDAGVAEPFASKTWPIPIPDGDVMRVLDAEATLDSRWRNAPNTYHNAGVWPYVGALHSAAASLTGRYELAEELLQKTAAANRAGGWRFSEWLHGQTGEPSGAPSQTWNAGAYLYAYAVLQNRGG